MLRKIRPVESCSLQKLVRRSDIKEKNKELIILREK